MPLPALIAFSCRCSPDARPPSPVVTGGDVGPRRSRTGALRSTARPAPRSARSSTSAAQGLASRRAHPARRGGVQDRFERHDGVGARDPRTAAAAGLRLTGRRRLRLRVRGECAPIRATVRGGGPAGLLPGRARAGQQADTCSRGRRPARSWGVHLEVDALQRATAPRGRRPRRPGMASRRSHELQRPRCRVRSAPDRFPRSGGPARRPRGSVRHAWLPSRQRRGIASWYARAARRTLERPVRRSPR